MAASIEGPAAQPLLSETAKQDSAGKNGYHMQQIAAGTHAGDPPASRLAGSQPEATSGFVDYLATYNQALTASEVANLPVPTTVPEPATMTLVATGLCCVAAIARRRRNASS